MRKQKEIVLYEENMAPVKEQKSFSEKHSKTSSLRDLIMNMAGPDSSGPGLAGDHKK
jgi:hypothetical protein